MKPEPKVIALSMYCHSCHIWVLETPISSKMVKYWCYLEERVLGDIAQVELIFVKQRKLIFLSVFPNPGVKHERLHYH